MATASEKYTGEPLKVAFDYDVEPTVGDHVELIAGRKVQKVASTGPTTEIGVVISVRSALKECVVQTRYLWQKTSRIAGEVVVAGPCLFGVGNKVYQYVPATHNAGQIRGMVVVGGAADAAVETLEF